MVKVDVYGNWSTNFGLNGTLAGTDIPLAANSTYDIMFNDKTKLFTIIKK